MADVCDHERCRDCVGEGTARDCVGEDNFYTHHRESKYLSPKIQEIVQKCKCK